MPPAEFSDRSFAGLRCTGLEASPGGVHALRGVDLEIAAGSRAALVGPSGAGKTTLLRAIAGLEPLDEGRVELDGRDLTPLPAHRRGMAAVFQEPRLFPNLDVAENVAFPLRAGGMRKAQRRERAKALLGEVGLAGMEGRRVRGLSGGEQQRVALARALSASPSLLLLDEPLAAVDPNRREGLRSLILRVQAERGLTMLLVTHDRAEAAELGQRIALMLEGRIVQADDPESLFRRPASPAVARFFGSRNMLRGEVRSGLLALPGGCVPVPGPDGPAAFTIRPERVALDDEGALELTVVEAAFLGSIVRLRCEREDLRVEAHVAPADAPPAGAQVRVSLPLEALWRFPELTARQGEPAEQESPAAGRPSRPAEGP